jgi:RNA polymerase sigma-70 factor, ECF subfamily
MNDYIQLSDSELVVETLRGNEGAFEVLVTRYEQPLYRYCKKLLSQNHHDSEEVVSETFYKAYKFLRTYDKKRSFSSWIYRIAHNTAVNTIRSKSKWFSVNIQDFFWIPMPQKEEAHLTHDELEDVLAKLSVGDRNVLILFYLQEKSLKEISDILKLSQNTIAQKLTRARKRARTILFPKKPNL